MCYCASLIIVESGELSQTQITKITKITPDMESQNAASFQLQSKSICKLLIYVLNNLQMHFN